MKTKMKTNGDSGRPLSPASINAIVNQEEEEDEEGSKKELVLTVLTIKELRDAVHRHIYGPHSVAFNFEGAESLDEIIPQIFTYEQQRGAMDNAEKERLYEKLMSDLNQAGYNQENIPQHPKQKPTFESTEDLLSCLSDESCSLVRTNGTSQTTSHPTSTMSLLPSLDCTGVNTSEIPINIAHPPSMGGKLNSDDDPNKQHIFGLLEHNECIIDIEDGQAAFEDIHLEEVPLDQVEHTDLIQPSSSQEVIAKPGTEDHSSSDSESSYYSAASNLSNSTTEILTRKSPSNANMSCDEPNSATTTINATEKTVKAKTPPLSLFTNPELTNEELVLWNKFNCRPLVVRIDKFINIVKSEIKDLPIPVKRGRGRPPGKGRMANKNYQKNAQSPVGQTFVAECSSPSVEILSPVIQTLPQSLFPLQQEESYAKVEGATRTGTGKTRIKARKVLPGELPAATLSPQDVSLSSCPVIPNEDESNRKVQVQMKLNVNLPTPPSSKKQYLSGEHEPFQLTTNLTCHTTYPQERNLQAILPTTITSPSSAQQPTSVSSESSSTQTSLHRHSLEEESLTVAPLPKSSSPSPPLVMGIRSSLFSRVDQETQEALSAPTINNTDSPVELSIEEELDALLGPIPIFLTGEDRVQMSLGASEGEFPEVAALLPEIFSETPSQESFLAEVDVAEVEVGSQNDDEDHHNVVLMENEEAHQESPLPESDEHKAPSSPKKCAKSPKRSPGPGPKSMTKSRESATTTDQHQEPNSSSNNMEEPAIKRLKRGVSPSSSSSSDTYLPLVPPSVSQSLNKRKSLSKSNSSPSKGKTRTPPSGQSTLKKGTSSKAVLLVDDVDVDESDSSSSSNSSEEDESGPSSEEDVDLFLILPAKPQEKKLLLSMKAECLKESPRMSQLEDLMTRTSSYRRRFLEKDNYDIHHGLIMFPPLKDYRFIKSEFNELTPAVAGGRMQWLEELLKDQLHNAWSSVKKRPGQKRHGLWERALLHARSDKQQMSKNVKRVLGMICLCFHWAENDVPKNLLLVRNRNEPLNWKSISTPRLVMFEDEVEMDQAASMYIYAEGLRHIQVPNIYEGVLTVYAMHYLFSIEYAPSLKPLFKHFDKLTNITG